MGCADNNKSSLKEARDQLFLDTADGLRLNNVTSNLGLVRPGIGASDDDTWRAIAKLVALKPKMILGQFLRVLDVILGPQFARIGTLADTTATSDTSIYALDPSMFTQIGQLIIDPTMPTEEIIDFCIRDLITGEFRLESEILQIHTPIAPGSGRLSVDAPTGALALTLSSTDEFSDTSFPYPVMLDRGSFQEEIVQVIANNQVTGVLTLKDPTQFDHFGPVTQYVKTNLKFPAVKFGSGDSIGGAAPNMQLTDAAASFLATDVGNYLTIAGGPSPPRVLANLANDGTFIITALIGGGPIFTTIEYTNSVGVAEAVLGGGWEITRPAPAGRDFLLVPPNAIKKFPASGFLRIDHNGPNDEVVEYTHVDFVANAFVLNGVTANPHVNTERVDLVKGGATVEVAQLVQLGKHWMLEETSPREIKIITQRDLAGLRLLDATWMHGAVPTTPPVIATTLTSNVSIGDFLLPLISTTNFINEAAMVVLNAVTYFYNLLLTDGERAGTVVAPTIIGATTLTYALTSASDFQTTTNPFQVVIDPGGGNQEFALVSNVNQSTSRLTFTAPLTIAHAATEVVKVTNQILLDKPLTAAALAGATVTLHRVPYAGTALEDGNLRDIAGAFILEHFPGGYVFLPGERGISAISSFLTVGTHPSLNLVVDQQLGYTNLEVTDASLWPAPPFTPFDVMVGLDTGHQETRQLIDRTLKADTSGALLANTLAGDTTFTYSLTGVSEFPESNGGAPAGYRIVIDRGNANEETVLVLVNAIGVPPRTFTLNPPGLTLPHLIGDTVELLSDVLTLEALLFSHYGPTLIPLTTVGETVQQLVTELTVSPAPTNFSATGGYVWLNFGKEKTNARSRIVTVVGPTQYTLLSTAHFPTTGFPYQVTIGDGITIEEPVYVTINNTITNTLTLATAPVNTHLADEYIKFTSGTPEVVHYDSLDTLLGKLYFTVPILLNSRHLINERVIFSTGLSESNEDGSSFGFKLPPDPSAVLRTILDLLRAAGVKVTITIAP